MGIHQAVPEAEITGIDINSQPEYPFNFWKGDVLKLTKEELSKFDFFWASPPCQNYSYSTARAKKEMGKAYPDLVAPTREMLFRTGKPFVLENVVGAPLKKNLWLCGCMFGLVVFRRRHFETHGFTVQQPLHQKHKEKVGTGKVFRILNGGCWLKKGEVKGSKEDWNKAMGIDWIKDIAQFTEAIPPAYSKYILEGFMETAVKPIPPPPKGGGL